MNDWKDKTLGEHLIEVTNDIEKKEKSLTDLKNKLEILKGLRQPTVKELYNGIDSYITIFVEDKEYEHILGGDGRSSAWSEKRKGLVAEIKLKEDCWFNVRQVEEIESYVKKTTKAKHIEIIGTVTIK